MIKGVIFDADGTLLDSMGFWDSTVLDIISLSGVKSPEPGLTELLTPMSMAEGAAYLKHHYGIAMPIEQIIAEENKRVRRFYEEEVTLCSGMGELVQMLHEANIPMIVATATDRPLIETALAHTGILKNFSGVLSCSDIGRGKDSPEIFLRACCKIGTAPAETIVAEDSPTALQTAAAAGFQVFDVTKGESLADMIFPRNKKEESS